MSTTTDDHDLGLGVDPIDGVTPVEVDASTFDATAPEHLRDVRRELTDRGLYPARISVDADFDADCSLATQAVADEVKGVVRAAVFLGAGTVVVNVEDVTAPAKARTALAACAERARRDGVSLEVDGPITLER